MSNLKCIACGREYRMKPEFYGKRLKCPNCQHVITVPSERQAATSNLRKAFDVECDLDDLAALEKEEQIVPRPGESGRVDDAVTPSSFNLNPSTQRHASALSRPAQTQTLIINKATKLACFSVGIFLVSFAPIILQAILGQLGFFFGSIAINLIGLILRGVGVGLLSFCLLVLSTGVQGKDGRRMLVACGILAATSVVFDIAKIISTFVFQEQQYGFPILAVILRLGASLPVFVSGACLFLGLRRIAASHGDKSRESESRLLALVLFGFAIVEVAGELIGLTGAMLMMQDLSLANGGERPGVVGDQQSNLGILGISLSLISWCIRYFTFFILIGLGIRILYFLNAFELTDPLVRGERRSFS